VAVQGLRYPASWRDWGAILALAALNNVVPFVMITTAQREVTGGIAAVFNATAPLFAIFLAALAFADERLSWRRVIGILTGIAGVGTLVGGGTASEMSMALLLGAAFCYALANVVTRLWLSARYPPFMIAASHMIAAFALATLGALLIDRPWLTPLPAASTVALVALMGLLGSAFASLCHFTILARAGATNAMLVTIVLPVTPIVLGALFLGERLAPREVVGALVIAMALVIIDGRAVHRLRAVVGRAA
jgi:drug/metabolite transporter (DMT)-like permease